MIHLEKSARETLRYLFSEYQKAPAVVYSINNIAKKYKADAVAISDYLLDHFLIRERWIYPDNVVTCRITIRGIEEIDPVYVHDKLSFILGGLVEAGGTKELMAILEHNIQAYAVAMDLIQQLESMALVEIFHTRTGNITISLTEEGRRYCEKANKSFFTLMMMA
ncbi:MAG: hypothetical protein ACOYXT_13310 [Bacteroidota bacterium]